MTEPYDVSQVPAEPVQKKNNIPLIIAIVALVILCCCCAGIFAVYYLWTYGDQIFNITVQALNLLV